MVFAGSSAGGRRPASALIWLIPPAATALTAALAMTRVPTGARAAAAWCGLAATLAVAVAAAEAVRRGRAIAALRLRAAEREAALRQRLVDQEAETRRLAKELLPAAVARLRAGAEPDHVMKDIDHSPCLDPDFESAHRSVLEAMLHTVRAEEDLREAAERAFVNIARRVQAIVHQQAMDVRDMEDKHGADPEVFSDLLHLDHGNALIGRMADSIAVLGGSRPGRQWQNPIPLYNVCRGAMSRILEYQRVDLHSVADVGIVGPSVEPLIHAMAELLDNATRYSPPKTRVHLTAVEVQSGVAIEIEDAGVGLTEEARRRTDLVLAHAPSGLDLKDLGETPRLGLAVVGRLAARYRFQFSLRPSAYGGVRAVLVIPKDITCTTPAPGGMIAIAAKLPPPKPVRRPTPTPSPTPVAARTGPDEFGRFGPPHNTAGLPQRRRRMPQAAPARGRAGASPAQPGPAAPAPTPAEPSVQPGLWLAPFFNGISGAAENTESGRPTRDDPSHTSNESDKGE
ncbi:ATP-binding protein [Streptomyces sparsogenes]|uniref:ATP-binding protein n=1 Tax=Streptomyces sparsogenes TaxID=67365 RepID=UPI0033FCC1D4